MVEYFADERFHGIVLERVAEQAGIHGEHGLGVLHARVPVKLDPLGMGDSRTDSHDMQLGDRSAEHPALKILASPSIAAVPSLRTQSSTSL